MYIPVYKYYLSKVAIYLYTMGCLENSFPIHQWECNSPNPNIAKRISYQGTKSPGHDVISGCALNPNRKDCLKVK